MFVLNGGILRSCSPSVDSYINSTYFQNEQDLKADPLNTLLLFRFTLLHAIYMWLATVPVVVGVIYVVLTPILKRVMPKAAPTDKKSA
jgi:hypothetical protein